MTGYNQDEEFVPEEEAENPAGVIKKLRERLHTAEKEKQEYLEGWQRSRAEFSNLKRDEETRRGYTEDRRAASLAEEIIPVLNSFEMAAKHNNNKELEIIQKQLLDSIKRMGIESFGKEGEMFNPERHEAVREIPVETAEKDHTVVLVERSGYAIQSTGQSNQNHIIRPAQASVGTFAGAKKL